MGESLKPRRAPDAQRRTASTKLADPGVSCSETGRPRRRLRPGDFPFPRVQCSENGYWCGVQGGRRVPRAGDDSWPGREDRGLGAWTCGHVDKSRSRDGGQQFDALGGAEIAVGRTADRTEAGSGGRTGAGEGTGASGRRRTSRFSSERRTRVCGRAFPVRKESETRRLGWWTRRGLEVV